MCALRDVYEQRNGTETKLRRGSGGKALSCWASFCNFLEKKLN